MATVSDLATQTFQRLGVIAATETPASDDAAYALTTLNLLVDQWATERLTVYTVTRSTGTVVASQTSYTVGSGGDINIVRPVFIEKVRFQDTSLSPVNELPLVPLTDDGYANIQLKGQTANYPQLWYYNPTYPLGTLIPWPIPTSSTLQWVIYHAAAVSQFASLLTSVALPPGYQRFIVTNLALELAPAYKVTDVGLLMQQARDAKRYVKSVNERLMDLAVDSAALVQGYNRTWRFNILTGQ